MGMSEHVKAFITNIMASATWEILKQVLGGSLVASVAVAIWQVIRRGSVDWIGVVCLFALMMVVLTAIFRRRKAGASVQALQSTMAPGEILPGIPTLSSLLGQTSAPTFDYKTFFAQAYYSPITAEVEKNIKISATQHSPADKEAFYARFIGVGVVAYFSDVTWFTIYKSQLLLLQELNSAGKLLPLSNAHKYYNEAKVKFPATYSNYSFDQWLQYMKARLLIIVYDSQMIDITHHGKDFLKYVMHHGYNVDAKAN